MRALHSIVHGEEKSKKSENRAACWCAIFCREKAGKRSRRKYVEELTWKKGSRGGSKKNTRNSERHYGIQKGGEKGRNESGKGIELEKKKRGKMRMTGPKRGGATNGGVPKGKNRAANGSKPRKRKNEKGPLP